MTRTAHRGGKGKGGRGAGRTLKGRAQRGGRSVGATAAENGKRRLAPDARERAIVDEAIRFFAEHGFKGRTRELARRLGITQPLLYRYFPNKTALIERVYEEVFVARWKPDWADWIGDRARPLPERLVCFYQDYTRTIMHYEWIRLFLFSGLEGLEINRRYLRLMRDRIWIRVVAEIRHETGRPTFGEEPLTVTELELVWALIAAIFYIGVRRYVFGLEAPDDLDAMVEDMVKAFFDGAPAAMAQPAPPHRRKGRKVWRI